MSSSPPDSRQKNCSIFPIFCDKTRPKTSGKIKKHTTLSQRLITNQNWSETKTSLRVLKPRQNRYMAQKNGCRTFRSGGGLNPVLLLKWLEYSYTTFFSFDSGWKHCSQKPLNHRQACQSAGFS